MFGQQTLHDDADVGVWTLSFGWPHLMLIGNAEKSVLRENISGG